MKNCEMGARPRELAVSLGGGAKLEMVMIPAGVFTMGDDQLGYAWEKPVHNVTITKPFYLGKYPVTQGQWLAVMGSSPSQFRGRTNPVEQISWDDCQAFLGALNAKVGEQGGKFVLPTEAQWEYACRAGSTTQFCFGDDESQLGEYAWHEANSGRETHPVGEKKPNAWGFHDMHGNVWEWCEDRYDSNYYVQSPMNDPTGSTKTWVRVGRGGSWGRGVTYCRSAYRLYFRSGYRHNSLGLRVARILTDG